MMVKDVGGLHHVKILKSSIIIIIFLKQNAKMDIYLSVLGKLWKTFTTKKQLHNVLGKQSSQ